MRWRDVNGAIELNPACRRFVPRPEGNALSAGVGSMRVFFWSLESWSPCNGIPSANRCRRQRTSADLPPVRAHRLRIPKSEA